MVARFTNTGMKPLACFALPTSTAEPEHTLSVRVSSLHSRQQIETKNRMHTVQGLGYSCTESYAVTSMCYTTGNGQTLNFLCLIGTLQNLISERYHLEMQGTHIGFIIRALVFRKILKFMEKCSV